jgi:ATP-dependent DNA helicase RecG
MARDNMASVVICGYFRPKGYGRGLSRFCGLRSVRRVTLNTPITELEWLPPLRVRQLARFGLTTVAELLGHFPRRYEDRTRFDHFPTETEEKAVCICGLVKETKIRRIRGSQKMFDVLLEEENASAFGGRLLLRWFNAHWVEKAIVHGHKVVAYGKPKRSGSNVVIAHPEFEVIEDDAEVSIHLQRIAPVHPATEGLSARMLRAVIWEVLERLEDDTVETLLPPKLDATDRAWALRQMHFPASFAALDKARRHLVLEEFLALQLSVAAKRAEHSAGRGASHAGSGALLARLIEGLPFALTTAQQRAIAEIRADLTSARPMNRLLHGDVGSGKTVVALGAMLLCVEAGWQAALMAPTQILAEQHYLNFRRLLEPLGVRVALRTGARREESGDMPLFAPTELADGLASDAPQILVGTHALLYEGAGVERLGLAVIDEQHKFGVLQRSRLREQGGAPDVLVMTATPIPRTLTMTVYGDLDVSTLDELPRGRGKIITGIRPPEKLPDAAKFLREQIADGRQAYVVYPLIDESPKLEAKAASAEYARWSEWLAPAKCELLHGRVASEEKDAIMERFRKGETKVLIATTVIEVGIDVPNANVMLIENAGRFGLAQLHQLRGRIGRGMHKSYCVLIQAADDEAAIEKLKILEGTTDGFVIAEADLRLRGPGDILGTAQSGLPPLKLGDLFRDAELMKLARNHAFLIFEHDPHFERAENVGCRTLLAALKRTTFSQVS